MNEPAPRVFADASPLIALARINRLDLLTLLPTPVGMTMTVWQELTAQQRPGVEALNKAVADKLLRIVELGDPAAYPQLDNGEASTLSAAASVKAAVIVDERKAAALIQRDPYLQASIPRCIRTVGLVVLAKDRGYISHVKPILDALRAETFRMSQQLYEEALRAASEWPPS